MKVQLEEAKVTLDSKEKEIDLLSIEVKTSSPSISTSLIFVLLFFKRNAKLSQKLKSFKSISKESKIRRTS